MFLGYRLKELRRSKNVSQAELGKLIGVSKVSVSGYENGTRMPSMDVLLKIIKLFDVSADYMFGRELNVVCEDSQNITVLLASNDIEIIREIRTMPVLYNEIAENPKRFFETLYKKRI